MRLPPPVAPSSTSDSPGTALAVSPSRERAAYVAALVRDQVPPELAEIVALIASRIDPIPPPGGLSAVLRSDEARSVHEAWRSGERDYGRLSFLVVHDVLRFPLPVAWQSVTMVAAAFPGRVSPSFVLEARRNMGSELDRYGAAGGPSPPGEAYVPVILLGVGLVSAWLIRSTWKL